MSSLRRYKLNGHPCFITSVTYQRNEILTNDIDLLRQSIDNTKEKTEFDIIAHVILPDHFHFLLDVHDSSFTSIIQRIKMGFGAYYGKRHGLQTGRIWQNRYWDHIIRDEKDLNNHIDYIHFNPVKHKYVSDSFEWEYSSIHRFQRDGYYEEDWGVFDKISFTGQFGE